MKKILVIGGLGFIGKSLVELYKDRGYLVKVTTKYHKNLSEDSFRSDYSKDSFLEIFSESVYEKIFFLSGNPYPQLSENDCNKDIERTLVPLVNAVEALKECSYKGSFWFSSSVAVYGATDLELQRETDECKPLSNYAVIKLAGENYLKMVSLTSKLNVGSFRIFSTFGEGLKRQIIYDLYKKCNLESNTLNLLGSGQEKRDLSYVADQALRILLIAEKVTPKGDIFNIGSGKSITTKKLAEEILDILSLDKKIVFEDNLRQFDGYQWTASIEKYESVVENPISDLKKSLEKTLIGFKKNEL